MIRRLRGQLAAKDLECATIDVAGVGYEVHMPVRALSELPAVGADVTAHIHTHAREDALLLYGFLHEADRDVFRMLLGVSGVGPKLALAILGVMSASELVQALVAGKPEALHKIPGVGKKTAERLLLDLRDRVGKLPVRSPDGVPAPLPAVSAEDQVLADLESALLNLGYRTAQVTKVLAKLPEEVEDRRFEVLLREALRRIS